MSLVNAVRQLRRRPRQLVAALILACLVGVAIPYKLPSMSSRQYHVGIASASALVDSTRSQVADLGDSTGTDVATLAYRASLFASLITSSPLKDEIAQRSGISSSNLIATGPTPVASSDSSAPAVSGASISSSSPNVSTLSASVPTLPAGQIPVIQVNTQGPTPAIAAKLATGAFAALQAEIDSVAGTDSVPLLQRVVIRPLGPAAATLVGRGPGLLFGIVGAVLAFVSVSGAVLGISSFRAALRRESTLNPIALDDPDLPLLQSLPHGAPIGLGPVEPPGGRVDDHSVGVYEAHDPQDAHPPPPPPAPRTRTTILSRTILSRTIPSVAPRLARVQRSRQRRVAIVNGSGDKPSQSNPRD